jgi:hypothetical protein
VVVKTDDGTCSRYGHLMNAAVKRGDVIRRYALIGLADHTGNIIPPNAHGAHLHYQRQFCASGIAVPSSFVEVGVPRTGDRVTSQNGPDMPSPPSGPTAGGGTLLQMENLAGATSWSTYSIRQDVRIVGAPGLIWGSSGGPSVFAAGVDGTLWQFANHPTGGWSTYQIEPPGTLSSSGGAVARADASGNFDVFTVRADGALLQVEHLAGAPSWSTYSIRPDLKVVGAPGLIWGSSGGPSVFAAGTDGSLWQFVNPGNGWSTYEIEPAGTLSSSGGAVGRADASGSFEVFTVGADGTLLQVEHLAGAPSWSTYSIRPDLKVVGAPGLIWGSSGGPRVFATTTDGSLWRFTNPGGGWSAEHIEPAGTLSSSGGAVARSDAHGNVDVFGVAGG